MASTQFERPFDYSTSSWVRDNDCRAKNVSKLAQYVALKSATSRGGIRAENVSKLAQYVALKSVTSRGGIRAKDVSKLAQYVALKSVTSSGGIQAKDVSKLRAVQRHYVDENGGERGQEVNVDISPVKGSDRFAYFIKSVDNPPYIRFTVPGT